MSYIKDEYYILKQNLIMLKHNIRLNKIEYTIALLLFIFVNVNIRMYNFDDVQCTVIPSVAYGFVTGDRKSVV